MGTHREAEEGAAVAEGVGAWRCEHSRVPVVAVSVARISRDWRVVLAIRAAEERKGGPGVGSGGAEIYQASVRSCCFARSRRVANHGDGGKVAAGEGQCEKSALWKGRFSGGWVPCRADRLGLHTLPGAAIDAMLFIGSGKLLEASRQAGLARRRPRLSSSSRYSGLDCLHF